MTLYENWLRQAYNNKGESLESFWSVYMPVEQKIYEHILENKITKFNGVLSELAKSHDVSNEFFIGFLDGINELVDNPLEINKITEDSNIDVSFSFENLYKKMVEYKAEHLYTLPQWENVFTEDEQVKLFKNQRSSTTIVKDKKIGRNDPCPCNSGKKYKKCCGAN